jgi:PAS domain S-box-containing protein
MEKEVKSVNGFPVDTIQLENSFSEQLKYNTMLNVLKGYEDFTLDVSGTIISSNLEATNITGYEEWEVMGKHFSIFYKEEDQKLQKPETDLRTAESQGRHVLTEVRLKKRSVNFLAKSTIEPLRNSMGMLLGYKLVIRDATHEALYRDHSKRIQDEYFGLVNDPMIGVFKFNLSNHKVLLFNEKATSILGRVNDPNLYFHDIFASRDSFDNLIKNLKAKGEVDCCEIEINSEPRRWVLLSCKCFAENNSAQGVIIDVTEKRQQMFELKRLNNELDDFIYHASHDLRGPLATVLGLVNLMQIEKRDAVTSHYGEMIRQTVTNLDELLKDIVSVAFNNNTGITIENIPFNELFETIHKEFASQLGDVKLSFDLDGEEEFHSDVIRVKTVLRNLISNAIRYSDQRKLDPNIQVSVRITNGQAIVNLRDNGVGIESKYMNRVFEIFFRGSDDLKGTGLGFYISKLMVNKLGGTIEVESSKGNGSTFLIDLPNMKEK